MRPLSRFAAVFGVCAAIAGAASAQPSIPQIVTLPTEDFTWPWGETRPIDDVERPEFTVSGVERAFQCTAKGSFKPGSRMRDTYAMREFEQALNGSIYFIQEATATLNQLDLSNDLQWAIMECIIPESTESEQEIQEDIDRALERAQREREKRREREAERAE
jgi:hypothetical protein